MMGDDTQTDEKQKNFIGWMCVLLAVLMAGNFIRSFYVEDAADKATSSAESVSNVAVEGRDASIDVQATLHDILDELETASETSQPDLNNQAIIDSLQAIARIEGYLCSGPCPEVPIE